METQGCIKCGQKMIRVQSGPLLMCNPPMMQTAWWCACGHVEDAGTVQVCYEITPASLLRQWVEANRAV